MMTRVLAAVVVIFAAALASGQTEPSTTQAASTQPANALEIMAADSVALFDRLNKILEAVTDEASAKAALPKIDQVAKDFAKLKETTQKMPKPTDEAMQQMMDKYGGKLSTVAAKFAVNQTRIRSDPKLEAIVGKPLDDLRLFQASTDQK